MWIVEARSHDDSDTLDCSGFHVVDAVRLRTPVACQPDDRWRNSLNGRGGSSICFRHAGSGGRVHPRVPDWRNGVHENAMLCTFNCKNAHQSDHCALGRRIGGLATHARPSPRPAPVTTATFRSNEIRSVISLSSCWEPLNKPKV